MPKIERKAHNPGIDVFSMSLVGGVLGFGLDVVLQTAPWCMIALFCFGFLGALWRIVRAASAT